MGDRENNADYTGLLARAAEEDPVIREMGDSGVCAGRFGLGR